jgi:hypothetical protein
MRNDAISLEHMEAAAEVIDSALGGYLAAHPHASARAVTALQLIAWIRDTISNASKPVN